MRKSIAFFVCLWGSLLCLAQPCSYKKIIGVDHSASMEKYTEVLSVLIEQEVAFHRLFGEDITYIPWGASSSRRLSTIKSSVGYSFAETIAEYPLNTVDYHVDIWKSLGKEIAKSSATSTNFISITLYSDSHFKVKKRKLQIALAKFNNYLSQTSRKLVICICFVEMKSPQSEYFTFVNQQLGKKFPHTKVMLYKLLGTTEVQVEDMSKFVLVRYATNIEKNQLVFRLSTSPFRERYLPFYCKNLPIKFSVNMQNVFINGKQNNFVVPSHLPEKIGEDIYLKSEKDHIVILGNPQKVRRHLEPNFFIYIVSLTAFLLVLVIVVVYLRYNNKSADEFDDYDEKPSDDSLNVEEAKAPLAELSRAEKRRLNIIVEKIRDFDLHVDKLAQACAYSRLSPKLLQSFLRVTAVQNSHERLGRGIDLSKYALDKQICSDLQNLPQMIMVRGGDFKHWFWNNQGNEVVCVFVRCILKRTR